MTSTKAVCGICLEPTGRDLNVEQTDYCDKHVVTRAYWHFWRLWRVDADKIPEIAVMKEALIEALKMAALHDSSESRTK
jgi:hypothetical protein